MTIEIKFINEPRAEIRQKIISGVIGFDLYVTGNINKETYDSLDDFIAVSYNNKRYIMFGKDHPNNNSHYSTTLYRGLDKETVEELKQIVSTEIINKPIATPLKLKNKSKIPDIPQNSIFQIEL